MVGTIHYFAKRRKQIKIKYKNILIYIKKELFSSKFYLIFRSLMIKH